MAATTRWYSRWCSRRQSSAAGSHPVSHLLTQTVLQQRGRGRPQQHLPLSSNTAAAGA